MKKRTLVFAVLLLLLFLAGCATVTKPIVVAAPAQTPAISPALADSDVKTLKRVVAIARFSNETNYGKGVYLNNTDNLGKQAMDIFSAKLVQTGKFVMLERSDMEFLDKEVSFNPTAMKKIQADYLIIGSITDFGRKNTAQVGAFSRTQKQSAYAKVNIRLVNVKTGQVLYGESGEGEAFSEAGTVLGAGAQAGFDATLNDKAIEASIAKLVNNIVNNLLNMPWKSYIISQSDGFWVMAGGKSQGISVGDTFDVMAQGKTVINPQTNLPIELPGTKVATLKVVQLAGDNAQNEVSMAELVDGKLDATQISGYYVTDNDK